MLAEDSELERLTLALAGRYAMERVLGRGGMATVYLARDLRHERRVAIKVLHPELSAVLGAERFLAEIKLTAALQHPHILPLFDSGAADGLLFYVMPFVDGETLRARLARETQLPVDDAVRIAQQVAGALEAAHRRGVIHRDIKPENILLQGTDALVADFGIALAVQQAGGQRMTQTGLSLGTPQYMSPEQAMGEREITARSDVYALGAVTYEMLAGEPPFTGPSVQAIIARVITEDARSLAAQRRAVPPHVDAAVHRALEKLPADRFGTAGEFAAALGGAGALPASAASFGDRPAGRRSVPWLAAAAVAVVALTLGALGHRLLARGTTTDLRYTQKTFELDEISNARFAPDGQTIVFSGGQSAQPPQLFAIRPDGGEPQSLADQPAHLLAVSSQRELALLVRPKRRSWSWTGTLARMPVGGGAPRELVESVRDADWSPDGSELAIVRVADGKDHLEFPIGKPLAETNGWFSDVRVAPDGRSIAFAEHPQATDSRGSINVVGLDGHRVRLGAEEYGDIVGVAWSRDGGEVLYSVQTPGVHQRVIFAAARTGGAPRQALNAAGNLTMHDVAANGRWLVTRDAHPQQVYIHDRGDSVARAAGWLDFSFDERISADGSLVAFSEASTESGVYYSVMLRPTSGGKAVRLGEGMPARSLASSFSHDNRSLLVTVQTRPARLVVYPTGAGTERIIPTDGLETIVAGGWGRGDSTVWFCGTTRANAHACWERPLAGGIMRPKSPKSLGASPDERWVFGGDPVRGVLLLTAAGDTVGKVNGLAPGDALIRWSPDSRAVWVKPANSWSIMAVDVRTGARSTLIADPIRGLGRGFVGVGISIADDPSRYAYSVTHHSSDLFLVDGIH